MLVQMAATGMMVGVIWFVQLVHYPMLHHSDGADREQGHLEYTQRMSWVVIPPMFTELGLQLGWLLQDASPQSWTGALLLLLIWLSTFFLQVPLHQKLAQVFDAELQRRLVRGNWIRTLAWSLRLLLLGWVIATHQL